jgi:hypothetical protein
MNKNLEKKCYVCGLELEDYPYYPDSHPIFNHEIICPSCGIHYGYDDAGGGDLIPDELTDIDWKFGDENHIKIMKFWREKWIKDGMRWWMEVHGASDELSRKPKDWNPQEQLKNIPEEFK